METEIDVANPNHILKPGMFAEADLVLERREQALVAPQQAVVNPSTRPQVYVVDQNNRVVIQPVKIGIEGADRFEITGGIAEGATIIVAGQNRLRSGQLVSPRPELQAEVR
jgi:membrane fusion protein (multidrug efflux system)